MQIWKILRLILPHAKFTKAPTGEKKEDKAIERSKGGINTKIHVVVDGFGNPLPFLLSPGNEHDSKYAIPLLDTIDIKGDILGDKAYGAKVIRDYIAGREAKYTIPAKSNDPNPWEVDYFTYKERHLVESFFSYN